MLGAVAAGALLGAARGYDITLDTKTDAGPDARADDEYKVVTTAGLEIVIGPKVGNEYDIASAVPSSNDNNLAVGIAVEGGDKPVTDVAGSCPGGITLDASTGDIACYGFAKVDPIPAVGAGSIVPDASATISPDPSFAFADCEGDIDVQIGDAGDLEIVCKDDGNGVAQTAASVTSFTVLDSNATPNDVSSTFTLVNCPGGITLDKSENEFVCYDVERGAAPVTNSVGGSIVVTETSEPNAALQEKTTIAGASNTITVNGGADLETEGINYKIELNTDDGTVTETVKVTASSSTTTVITNLLDAIEAPDDTIPASFADDTDITIVSMKSEDDSGDLKLETVDVKTELTISGTTTVTDYNIVYSTDEDEIVTKTETVKLTASSSTKDSIEALFDDIAALDDTITPPFADGTVIEIESKSADDDGELKLETVVVTTELTESGTTTVTDYNIDYSENDDGILGFIKEIKTDKPGSEDESVTTTFFLTGDDSLPDPDGGEIDVTAGKYLDLFEDELSRSLTVAEYRNRLPAGGKLPASFKDEDKIKDEAILKFEIEGTFVDPSRLALTANLTTQVSGGTSRKLLQQGGGVTQKETEFRSQIDDDDNIEESLKEVEKDAGGNVIRFSANEIKIEEDPQNWLHYLDRDRDRERRHR